MGDQVHTQLAAQKIYFPPASSGAIKALPAADAKAMTAYAGQQMTNGAQAQTYADHFIAVHLREIGGGKTYSQLSAASLAQPKNAARAGTRVMATLPRRPAESLLLLPYFPFPGHSRVSAANSVAQDQGPTGP